MAVRAFEEMDAAHSSMDGMHDALMGVYESGRALRLMLKLAFVNERPEFGIDQRWSESGDCYILKLFRDFGKCELNASVP
jgi:PAB-dependent poly(A)-specific ribonuclease subunit 3